MSLFVESSYHGAQDTGSAPLNLTILFFRVTQYFTVRIDHTPSLSLSVNNWAHAFASLQNIYGAPTVCQVTREGLAQQDPGTTFSTHTRGCIGRNRWYQKSRRFRMVTYSVSGLRKDGLLSTPASGARLEPARLGWEVWELLPLFREGADVGLGACPRLDAAAPARPGAQPHPRAGGE